MVQCVVGAAVMVRADIPEILNDPSCVEAEIERKSVTGDAIGTEAL